jgi:universal stress protein E
MTQLPTCIAVGISLAHDDESGRASLAFTEHALFQQALQFATAFSAKLLLVSVIDAEDDEIPGQPLSLHELLRTHQEPFLQELVERATISGVAASSVLRFGPAATQLLAAATEGNADLIMVAPRRSRDLSLGDLLHGSTTQRLLRKSHLPVSVVHFDMQPGIQNIALAVDFSDVSRRQLDTAVALGEVFGARVHVVHAIDFPNDIALRRLPDPYPALEAYHEQVRTRARQHCTEFLGALADSVTVHIAEDYIVRSLPEYVKVNGIDLVIAGSIGRSGISGLLIGNTAEKLFRVLDITLWVMKPHGWKLFG